MKTAVKPPIAPMEAQLTEDIPLGSEWQYEPKWDGFRCLAFREGQSIFLQSKSGQPLARYFPEIVEAVREIKATKFVLDGELVVPIGRRSSFDDLLQRIHPAASRVNKLARERPAIFIVFDLLEDEEGLSLLKTLLEQRRAALERFSKKFLPEHGRIHLSPATRSRATAQRWFRSAGAALDGVIAKRLDLPYLPGERSAMQKVKPIRTADCVVGGLRRASRGDKVGSLLLGLYNRQGQLDHVGFTSSFTVPERNQVSQIVREHVGPPGFTGKAPGGPSRWSTKRSSEWTALDDKLVVEVEYDQFTAGRFRHGTKLLRWRPDKSPKQCTFDQLEQGGGSLRLLMNRHDACTLTSPGSMCNGESGNRQGDPAMAKYGSTAKKEVKKAVSKTKRGKQRSGKKGKAKSRKQAIAIGLSKARKKGGKVPPKKKSSKKKSK